jgi:hypothetical protein
MLTEPHSPYPIMELRDYGMGFWDPWIGILGPWDCGIMGLHHGIAGFWDFGIGILGFYDSGILGFDPGIMGLWDFGIGVLASWDYRIGLGGVPPTWAEARFRNAPRGLPLVWGWC